MKKPQKIRESLAPALLFLLLFILNPLLTSEEYGNQEGGYRINIPVAWDLYGEPSPEKVAFIAPDQTVVFQVEYWSGETFSSPEESFEILYRGIATEADGSSFNWNGYPSYIADLTFPSGENIYRGWFLFIEHPEKSYVLSCFSAQEDYDDRLSHILSCLDSFALNESPMSPGPVSQFMDPAMFDPENRGSMTLSLPEGDLQVSINPEEGDSSQSMIEREAFILSDYQGIPDLFPAAWKRYYRLIWRDNYLRLKPVADELKPFVSGMTDRKKAEYLLKWLQGFSYSRLEENLSDLQSPVNALAGRTGDCDALGLIYSIILNHWNIRTLLFVSHVYSHALGGVEVGGNGISIPYEGRNYLVAEFTAEIPLGFMDSGQADFSKWMAVPFW